MNVPSNPESTPSSGPALSLRRLCIAAGALAAVAVIVAIGCSMLGRLELHWPWWDNPIWLVRLTRLAISAIVGAGLATGGMALQGMLRNPLAEPYVLGISSGAGVGVLAGMILSPVLALPDWLGWPLMAMAGAVVTSLVVYMIAQRRGRLDPYVLLLSGVIINVLNGAIILGIMMFLKTNELIYFIGWGMGQVPEWLWSNYSLLLFCAACVLGGWAALFVRGAALNTLGLGDDVAASSGISVHWLRVEIFFVVSLMTAAAVSLAGPVGFLGLVVPHTCRLVVGADHRRLAIYSGFVGAIFLMLADTFCRIAGEWVGKAEIPLGIVTAMVGGPFFIVLLRRRSTGGRP